MSINNVGDAGATSIAAALKVSTGATYVGLSDNEIGDTAAAPIAAALKVSAGIIEVGASYNSGITGHSLLQSIEASCA